MYIYFTVLFAFGALNINIIRVHQKCTHKADMGYV